MAKRDLNLQYYLDQLLGFAQRRLRDSNGRELEVGLLEETFCQRFNALHDEKHKIVVNQPVRQVRLAIEVLRTFLGDEAEIDEGDYVLAAYLSMLQNFGISYEELRLANSDKLRAKLAPRLGIDAANPQYIKELTLKPQDISEETLESLFGITSTQRDPLVQSPLTPPKLLKWQLGHLRSVWIEQDDSRRHDSFDDMPLPVIDPDVVSERDLKVAAADVENPAIDIRAARQQFVETLRAEIREEREGIDSSAKEAFDHIIAEFLGDFDLASVIEAHEGLLEIPVDPDNFDIADLLHRQGIDLQPQLSQRQLGLSAFLHLGRIRNLAIGGTVLEEEWDGVYSILIQVQKIRRFSEWRDAEKEHDVLLSPDLFQVSDDSSLNRWRAPRATRRAWENILAARINQEQTTRHALQVAVGATEEATLPLLRDRWISTVASTEGIDFDEAADLLTSHLLIDFKADGSLQTTRLQQAIETVRGLIFSVRIDRFETVDHLPSLPEHPAAKWSVNYTPTPSYTEADFDEEWKWMGSFGNWRAALYVLVYPESFLLPNLYAPLEPRIRSQAFNVFIGTLRSMSTIAPEKARNLANGYLKARRDEERHVPEGFPDEITELLTDHDLANRRNDVRELFVRERASLRERHVVTRERIEFPHKVSEWVKEIYYFVPMALALKLQRSGHYLAALDWFKTIYAYHFRPDRRKIYYGLVLEEKMPPNVLFSPDEWLRGGLNPHVFANGRKNIYTQFTLLAIARCFLDFADQEFTQDTLESVPRARDLYLTVLDLLEIPDMHSRMAKWPPNTLVDALRDRARLNLSKLRSGRNIAGMEKPTLPHPQEQDSSAGLPVISSGGQLILSRPATLRPTPYRYSVLVTRAKELVAIAQQVEATFLSALEKRDEQAYNLLRAHHELQLSEASIELQDIRINEADERVQLMQLQEERSEIQRDTYQDWIDAGLNRWEESMIDSYYEAASARKLSATQNFMLEFLNISATASAGGATGSGALALVPVAMAVQFAALEETMNIIAAETDSQVASVNASHERRQQEWELQKSLTEKDSQIGGQQKRLAQIQKSIISKEKDIARVQVDHGAAMVDFLANKFLNAELYEWMSGILGQVYSYFLQQATAMAQLAANQLSFERQDVPPPFIQADYWVPPSDSAEVSNGDGPDRRGLTGSARLLRDIHQLDQFAFETNKRKLQITQTISLAKLYPFEFQQFRQTGVLPFATPMEHFDRDFPGHYLRLIKRVRVSMIALVPRARGIRATLTASGVSRVVVGPDVFQTVDIRRSPEMIAFTSPNNATGLFEMAQEEEMLLPFEGMGVDTNWEFELPRPANPFDFNTIADVLLTIEYTALHNDNHRQQVVNRLDRRFNGERPLSIRSEFADQWYELSNPLIPDEPSSIRLNVPRQNFPPNVDNLVIDQALIYFRLRKDPLSDEAPREVMVEHLAHTNTDGDRFQAGATRTVKGLVSTRGPNGSPWTQLLGRSPVGEWELSLPPSEASRVQGGEIEDVLLIIVFSGETPPWPD